MNRDQELISFLRVRGESYGMEEPKLSNWVLGMSDEEKAIQLLHSFLSQYPVSKEEPCLDMGCGFGNLVLALSQHFRNVSGIDLIEERVEWSRRRCPSAEIVCGKAEGLPWPANHFGLITSTDVFEHLNHEQQALAANEIARVLKPGGHAFITVPSKFQIKDEHNYIPFGTWMPEPLRRAVSMRLRHSYLQCWEHSGPEWRRIFENAGLTVKSVPQKPKRLPIFASRFHLFARKPLSQESSQYERAPDVNTSV